MKTLLSTTLVGLLAASSALAEWEYSENIDPFTDQNSSTLVTPVNESSKVGRDNPELLVIRCNSDSSYGYELFVVLDGYIGDEFVPVRYRFDKEEVVSKSVLFHASTSGTAVFYYQGGDDEEFAKRLLKGGKLLFEVSDYKNTRSYGVFDIAQHPKLKYFIVNGCGKYDDNGKLSK